MIAPTDLTGIETGLARRIIAVARSIAPCIITLPDGEDRTTAIAILAGVAKDVSARGSRFIKGQRIGPASIDYGDSGSWFSADDRAALGVLCNAMPPGSTPIGSFPRPARVISRLFPEDC